MSSAVDFPSHERHASHDRSAILAAFLRRPVSVSMAFLALLVVGAIAYTRIPLQLFPSGFQPSSLSVQVTLPDSTPSEVERQVTRPLERVMGTIAGLESMRSWTSESGVWMRLRFDDSISSDDAYLQTWDRLDRVMAEFPDDVRPPRVRRFDPDDFPIAFIGVSLDEDADPTILRDEKVFRWIENRLMRNPGVARVQVLGNYGQTVDIDVQRDQMEGLKVNLYELVGALQRDNFTMGAGEIREGGRNHSVRSLARFRSVAEVFNYQVRDQVRLNDIAKISNALALENEVVRINGQRSVCLLVNKKSDANTIDVARQLRATLTDVLPHDALCAQLEFHMLWDQGETISDSLENLRDTILQGAVVAVFVLLLFLRHLRMTLIVTLAIPISLLAAITAMYFLGETINLVSLMGITLAVGMLVDNSVVVVESIQNRSEQGDSPFDAALVGTSRVALAVLIATSTTIVVFIPLMVAGDSGQMRFFLIRMGLPVCLSLTASLLVAMVLIPPASRALLGGGRTSPSEAPPENPGLLRRVAGGVDRGIGGTIDLAARAYAWLLELGLRRRLEVVVIACAVFYASMSLTSVETTDLNEGERRDFTIRVRMPEQFTLREANDMIIGVEKKLLDRKKALDIDGVFTSFRSGRGRIRVFMTDLDQMTRSREDVIADVRKLVPTVAGVRFRVGNDEESNRSERTSMPVVLEGRDTDVLLSLASEVAELLRDVPGVDQVQDPLEDGRTEVIMRLDRELCQRYGVDPQVAMGMISYSYRGRFLPKLRAGDREIWLRIRMDRTDDPTLDEVKALLIPTTRGTKLPLGTVARFERRRTHDTISRENRRTVLRINCWAEKGLKLREMTRAIQERLALLKFPEGYGYRSSERWEKMAEQQSQFNYGAILSVFLVFFLMGFLFESWLMPLAILFSIPFAFVGVWCLLDWTDTQMDVMVFLGLIVLIGIVINNGVVLIDRVHQLRGTTPDRESAIVAGARERFRPILMTALTTIGGLVPMAIGGSATTGVPYYPLGRTVIGGLAASTVMTLFIVPVIYALLDDLGRLSKAILARSSGTDVR